MGINYHLGKHVDTTCNKKNILKYLLMFWQIASLISVILYGCLAGKMTFTHLLGNSENCS